MDKKPVYISGSTARSVWQEYRILLTPEDPGEFVSTLDEVLSRYREDSDNG